MLILGNTSTYVSDGGAPFDLIRVLLYVETPAPLRSLKEKVKRKKRKSQARKRLFFHDA